MAKGSTALKNSLHRQESDSLILQSLMADTFDRPSSGLLG